MASKKNNKRSRTAQLRRRQRLRRNIFRLLLRSLVWIGAVILYYAIFSLFLDTPYEYTLRRSTDRLRAEYEVLAERWDSLSMVMENIEARDKSIYQLLFESDPYDFRLMGRESDVKHHEDLLKLSTGDLRRELNRRTSQMGEKSRKLVESNQNLVDRLVAVGEGVDNIPAIQPIANKQLTLLTASYGMRMNPFYKKLQPHQGVDFTIPEGTRVFASADGVVKSVTLRNSTQGKSIIVDHGNGYETSYSHLGKVDAIRNQKVKRGETIGYSGNTGLSLIPHLHYEVRFGGVRVDPIHYFFGELSPDEYQRMIQIAQSGMQSFD
ncbi:MAG: M23 family metallopeptidase [Rikenellaceae bacterium]